ncbi:MAG: hypothetical protein NTX13_00200 [Acidobacteria bacterium]|nr:hypothetical protein [Acidobacteriota bacterium]
MKLIGLSSNISLRTRHASLRFAGFLFAVGSSLFGATASPKISPDLAAMLNSPSGPGTSVNVIVQF